MAGAGYKLFNTGDVLTAAQVNTFLMEQTVMVFNDATARTAALSGVVAEGMLSYLKSTKQVEVYNGTAWVASDDPNAIQNTIVDAKGDLITATAADVPARLAVGANGETIVADSSTSTGLRWQGNFAAGKNKIINGDFGIWQRGTSFNPSAGGFFYTADRWQAFNYGTSATTVSQQTFTAGSAPVAGYEGQYFLRINSTNTRAFIQQPIEDVRTLAGQTVTVSLWAKSASNQSAEPWSLVQTFGSGGSATVETTLGTPSVTTSWQRFSFTVSLPSISGKTIGASNLLALAIRGSINNALDIWGVQVEAGNTATAFQTATGTLAGELAACQRYYWRPSGQSLYGSYGFGNASSTTQAFILVNVPVTLRSVGSVSVDFSTLSLADSVNTPTAVTALSIQQKTDAAILLQADVASGLTQYRPYRLSNNNSTSGYVGFSAEL